MQYKRKTLITQKNLNFKIFNFYIRDLCQNIYQAPKHPWKQSDTPEPPVFKFANKV